MLWQEVFLITFLTQALIGLAENVQSVKSCGLDNGEDGECVPTYLCNNGKQITDGANLIDIRTNVCDDYFETCCAIPSITKEISENYIPPGYVSDGKGNVVPNTTAQVNSPCSSTGNGQNPVISSPLKAQYKCGMRNEKGVGFSITGTIENESEYGEFPWMMAIINEQTATVNTFECGGSLIDRNVVLTAAHCVHGIANRKLKVRAGEWDTQTKNEPYPHSDYEVNEIVIHPDFKKANLHNDIALLFLSKEVEDQPHIRTVCLPPQDKVFEGSRCFASGWGKKNFGKEEKTQVILKKVELPIVSHESCQNSFRQTRLSKYFKLDKSFMCAGGEQGKDTCTGDGGSPLVCPASEFPGSYYQAGIVAWGIGCGDEGVPGAYANVALFRSWIDQQVQSRGYETSSYTAS